MQASQSVLLTGLLFLSYGISAYLIFRLVRSTAPVRWKITYTLLLLIPVLGPFMYVWIANFPASSPEELREEFPGLSDKFLNRELSERDGGRDLIDVFREENKSYRPRRRHSRRRKKK